VGSRAADAIQLRPGDEIDAAIGAYYDAGIIAGAGKLAPLLQLIGSYRWHDTGAYADPQQRLSALADFAGIEYDIKRFKLTAISKCRFTRT